MSMTEQVPEDLTEAEVTDRREADRSEDEGDTASEVDRWATRAGTTAPAEPSGLPTKSHERPGPRTVAAVWLQQRAGTAEDDSLGQWSRS
jgi:hypothetical protein